jgi:hypothetical protein
MLAVSSSKASDAHGDILEIDSNRRHRLIDPDAGHRPGNPTCDRIIANA